MSGILAFTLENPGIHSFESRRIPAHVWENSSGEEIITVACVDSSMGQASHGLDLVSDRRPTPQFEWFSGWHNM